MRVSFAIREFSDNVEKVLILYLSGKACPSKPCVICEAQRELYGDILSGVNGAVKRKLRRENA